MTTEELKTQFEQICHSKKEIINQILSFFDFSEFDTIYVDMDVPYPYNRVKYLSCDGTLSYFNGFDTPGVDNLSDMSLEGLIKTLYYLEKGEWLYE